MVDPITKYRNHFISVLCIPSMMVEKCTRVSTELKVWQYQVILLIQHRKFIALVAVKCLMWVKRINAFQHFWMKKDIVIMLPKVINNFVCTYISAFMWFRKSLKSSLVPLDQNIASRTRLVKRLWSDVIFTWFPLYNHISSEEDISSLSSVTYSLEIHLQPLQQLIH